MRLQGDATTDPRLHAFFDASSDEDALEAFHLLWESALMARVCAYLKSQKIPPEVRSDLETETYLRVCQSLLHRRTKADADLTPPQQATLLPVLITNCEGYAIAAARSLLYTYFLAQNPVWRRLQLRVIAHLKQGEKVTRWKQEFRWLAGLTKWKETSFRAKSARAQAFLNEDYTAFRQQSLRNQEPSEIALEEVLCRIFRWLDSPLWQNRLVGHLLTLYRQETRLPLSWEEISAEGEQQEEVVGNEGVEDLVATKQALREALCQDGLLDRLQRGVLLLKLDSVTLTDGLGMTFSETALSLGLAAEALFGEEGEILLPLPDNRIAALLGVQGTSTMTAVERVSTYYRMSARRKLARWLKPTD
jgi:hypothetical protein